MIVVLDPSLGEGSDFCKAKPQRLNIGYLILKRLSLGRLTHIEKIEFP